jgi:hypothetical protein
MGFTDAGRIIRDITWNYGKYQIQSIIDTGQVRRMTPADLKKHPYLKDEDPVYLDDCYLYVEDPVDIHFPETYGAASLTILLNRDYGVKKWENSLMGWWDHSTLYGWTKKGEAVVLKGYNRPHEPRNHDESRKAKEAIKWYAEEKRHLVTSFTPEHPIEVTVNFSTGDIWEFEDFLYDYSPLYYYKDKNPAEHLAEVHPIEREIVFISDNIAVRVPSKYSQDEPLITLTPDKPIASGLAGHTFIIESVEVDERHPKKAKITLK